MNSIKNLLKERGIKPRGFEYRNNVIIIDTNDGKFVLKKDCNNCDIYDYLNAKGFYNYPPNQTNRCDNYDLSIFIEDTNVPKEQRIEDLIKTLSILHYKTSYYQEVDLDEIKKVYEKIKNELFNLFNYYNELNDYLDNEMFLSPACYLLLRNISLIYKMIDYSNKKVDLWYQMVSNSNKERTCLIHNNVSLDHLLINDNNYLVSWDKSRVDRPIIDLVSFYKKYYKFIKLEDVFRLYDNINCLMDEEKCLLLIYLSIPKKIVFTKNQMNDVIDINNELLYLSKVYEYIRNS